MNIWKESFNITHERLFILWEDMVGKKDEEVVTFEFPIRDPGGIAQI